MCVGSARRVPRPRYTTAARRTDEMTRLLTLQQAIWQLEASADDVGMTQSALEAGDVVFLPNLRFAVEAHEQSLFTPAILGSAKNASYDPAAERLGGTTVAGADRESLQAFMQRFS